MIQHIYLDYNATAPMRPEVLEVITELMRHAYNPSSVHACGRAAKAIIERSRKSMAEQLSCFPAELVFLSGGTEANNTVLQGLKHMPLAVSATEHSSILKVRNDATLISVDRDGILRMDELECWLAQQLSPALVSVMLANNETGIIQPIQDIANLVHRYNGLLHCDAVQALGKIPVDITLLGADMMSFSAHKIGAGQGVGALFISQSVSLPAFIAGGGQELGRRGGTENVAAIAGFAAGLELALQDKGWQQRVRIWMDEFEARAIALAGNENIILGKKVARLPNTTAIRMPDITSQSQLMQYDLAGFAVSAGSACSSGRIEPSHVIRAMQKGNDEVVMDDVIRVSAGWGTKKAEIEAFSQQWERLIIKKLKNNA